MLISQRVSILYVEVTRNMDILEILKARRSVRKYKAEPVSKEELCKIVEAGEYAASAMGKQSAIIIAVSD